MIKVFLGPTGIRAGWRLLIFVALEYVAASVLLILLDPALRQSNLPPPLAGEGVDLLAALSASLVMARIENRSLADYGLPLRGAFGARFWLGALWGFLALTALLVAMHLGHGFDFGGLMPGGTSLLWDAALWGLTFVVVGLAEEYIFRGYALATLATGLGFWPSAILVSAAFGASHLRNPGEDGAGALAAAMISLFFCLTLRRTGSLWFAIGMHASWDYAQSFLYSVPNSGTVIPEHLLRSSLHGPAWLTGGSVGPEGSVLVFGVIGVVTVVFNALYRQPRFPAE